MEYRSLIIVSYICTGLHHWPEAPKTVGWLRHEHRHRFTVKMTVTVDHDDREQEFFIVKGKLRDFMKETFDYDDSGAFNFGRQSCEDIARKIAVHFDAERVEVWEDGENAGVVVMA